MLRKNPKRVILVAEATSFQAKITTMKLPKYIIGNASLPRYVHLAHFTSLALTPCNLQLKVYMPAIAWIHRMHQCITPQGKTRCIVETCRSLCEGVKALNKDRYDV